MSVEIITAQPGYYLLNVMYAGDVYAGGPSGFEKTPVIAWKIFHAYTHPVGDAHSLADAVMRPDGSVYIPDERFGESKQFGDEAEALRYFVDEYRKHTNNT